MQGPSLRAQRARHRRGGRRPASVLEAVAEVEALGLEAGSERDEELLQYLVHSRVTEQRASEEVEQQKQLFGDDPEIGRALGERVGERVKFELKFEYYTSTRVKFQFKFQFKFLLGYSLSRLSLISFSRL